MRLLTFVCCVIGVSCAKRWAPFRMRTRAHITRMRALVVFACTQLRLLTPLDYQEIRARLANVVEVKQELFDINGEEEEVRPIQEF